MTRPDWTKEAGPAGIAETSNMEHATHTPTPLETPIFKKDYYDPSGLMYEYTVIYDAGKYEIGKANDPDYAAFIVRAVNSHHDLLEALEKLADHVDGWGDSNDFCGLTKLVKETKTIIAKARGEA